MSQTLRGIIGAAAIALMLGAVPLAAGRDFSPSEPIRPDLKGTSANAVNRAVKADRITSAISSGAVTQTISLQLSGLSDTMVLVRVPAAPLTRSGSSPAWTKPNPAAKTAVACEPVVSMLTEVAKLLEPGRCMT